MQAAKSFGADVTGVCSSPNILLVQNLGADAVIDYARQDFTRTNRRYDLILDCVGNHSLAACRRALTSAGTLVVITGPNGPWLGPISRLLQPPLLSRFVGQKLVPFIAHANAEDLAILGDLMETGKVRPVIDRCYPLREIADALRYLEAVDARGKVVISLA